MKHENEFDELARRKLEERTFPYDEANWLAVQRALEAERRRRRGIYWSLAAGLLLLVSVGTWWRAANNTATPATTEVANTTATPEVNAIPEAPTAESTTNAPEAPDSLSVKANDQPLTPQRTSANVIDAPVEEKTKKGSIKRTPAASAHTSTASTPAPTKADVQQPKPGAQHVEPPVIDAEPATPLNAVTTEPSGGNSTPANTPPLEPEPTPSIAATTGTLTPQGTDSTTATVVQEPTVADTSATQDSTFATASSPQDPAAAAPTLPPSAPILPPKPWEITALSGLLTSTSNYSGGTSAIWGEGLTGERTTGFGLEVMHMDRHFGYGTGLHYTNYSERINSPDKYADVTSYQDVFFLTPVDTTVLAITDTIFQQGQYYYVTTPITTTIFVLDQTVDTVITNMRVQQAKEHVNTLSYLEVPLLFDAHTGKGHWSFGVRGGPTIGLLTGKRGSLPDNVLDGFVDYADQPFRSYALGYVARAYVRYGFCTAWSVGIEPTIRGHLTDAYQDYGLTRRSSGFGAMLSLSYRLP